MAPLALRAFIILISSRNGYVHRDPPIMLMPQSKRYSLPPASFADSWSQFVNF